MLLILSLFFQTARRTPEIPGSLQVHFHLSFTGGTIIESFTLYVLTLTEGRCGCRNCDQHESEDRIVGTSKRSHGQNFSFSG